MKNAEIEVSESIECVRGSKKRLSEETKRETVIKDGMTMVRGSTRKGKERQRKRKRERWGKSKKRW